MNGTMNGTAGPATGATTGGLPRAPGIGDARRPGSGHPSGSGPAAGAPHGAVPLRPQGIEEIRNLVATLAACFERGALDDHALARLLAAAESHSAQASRAGLRRAVDDFDFALARSRLATLLAECTAGAGRQR